MISLQINKLKNGIIPLVSMERSDSKKIEDAINVNISEIEVAKKALKSLGASVQADLLLVSKKLDGQKLIDDDFRSIINTLKTEQAKLNNEVQELKKIISGIKVCACPKPKIKLSLWQRIKNWFSKPSYLGK